MARVRHSMEKALGGGNCAFNAFILGLAEKEVLDSIETNLLLKNQDPNIVLKDFISIVNNALLKSVNPTWTDIKNVLIQEKQTNKNKLQNSLNYEMRQFALARLENTPSLQKKHFESTLNPLCVELENYFTEMSLHGRVQNVSTIGDIFIRHGFIEDRFEIEFCMTGDDIEKAKENLKKWWEKFGGYQTFLGAMKVDGVWAGDLELAVLADYLGVNLDVISRRFNHQKFTMHFHHGVFETKSMPEQTIKQLITRGVVDKEPVTSGQYRWAKQFSEEELISILSAVPEWKNIETHFDSLPPKSLKNQPVNLPAHLKTLLHLVEIAREDKQHGLVFDKEATEVLKMVKELNLPAKDYDLINDIITEQIDPMKRSVLPFDVSMETLAILGHRGIIQQNGEGQIIFSLTKSNANSRAHEIAESAEVIAAWKANHCTQTTITLQNNFGDHWDNIHRHSADRSLEEKKPEDKKSNDKKFQWQLDTCLKRQAYADKLFSKNHKRKEPPAFDEILQDEKRKSDNRIKKEKKLEQDLKNKKIFAYSADDKTTLFVSKTSFMKLDRALTLKLQREIYDEEKAKSLNNLLQAMPF